MFPKCNNSGNSLLIHMTDETGFAKGPASPSGSKNERLRANGEGNPQ